MIRGETVTVELVNRGEYDRMGNAARSYAEPESVYCAVVPSSASESSYLRPDGTQSTYTLHFPRGYAGDLRGARVTVRGETFHVLGDPKPYTESNVRGPWTMPVEVGRHDG